MKRLVLKFPSGLSVVLVVATLSFWIGSVVHLSMRLTCGDELGGASYMMQVRDGKVTFEAQICRRYPPPRLDGCTRDYRRWARLARPPLPSIR